MLGQIRDMRAADDRHHVMLAVALEADVLQHDHFVVPVHLGKRAGQDVARFDLIAREEFLVRAHHARWRIDEPFAPWVVASPAQQHPYRVFGFCAGRAGRYVGGRLRLLLARGHLRSFYVFIARDISEAYRMQDGCGPSTLTTHPGAFHNAPVRSLNESVFVYRTFGQPASVRGRLHRQTGQTGRTGRADRPAYSHTGSRLGRAASQQESDMINKIFESLQSAVADIHDGATVMIGGFGTAGMPSELIDALIEHGARELTIVNNNAGNGDIGLAVLLKARRVRKIICSFPRQTDSYVFDALYRAGEIELELVPQGNLAERIRAAGAGIGGFFTPTGYGTRLAEGKETRLIDGRHYVLEAPLHADFALIKAYKGDRWGNLTYRKTARNFGPIMASAAKTAIVQVSEVVPLGALDPEEIVTPGIFVQRVIEVPQAAQRASDSAAAAA